MLPLVIAFQKLNIDEVIFSFRDKMDQKISRALKNEAGFNTYGRKRAKSSFLSKYIV